MYMPIAVRKALLYQYVVIFQDNNAFGFVFSYFELPQVPTDVYVQQIGLC